MLIHPSEVAIQTEESGMYDIEASVNKVNFSNLINRVKDVIDEESLSINPKIEANPNIDWYREPAAFINEKEIKVGDQVITGDKIFIAAGARPQIPDIEGLKDTPYMTSTEALYTPKQHKRMIVIGGGIISVELGSFFAGLGTEVHQFVRSEFIRHEDEEVVKEFSRMYEERKRINVVKKAKITKVEYEKEIFKMHYTTAEGEKKTIEAEALLVATGVVPNTDILNVEKAGIKMRKGGYIEINNKLETNVKNIWAFGDIASKYQFRHAANFEGEYLFETIINNEAYAKENNGDATPYELDYTGMPHAIFSYPQVASVGLSEKECKEQGIDYVKGVNKYQWSAMGMALRSDLSGGLCKLIIEKKTRKILGCHIVGHEASVLLHEVTPLIRMGGKLDDILYSIHVHPALSEIVRNAARRAKNALIDAGDDVPLRLRGK
eukprot:CAMPEP_0117424630 /NCGR_PEP_ID=MMETSP0758-20121206/5012_1 /TAXON_ID=63605 /ORGANISM="Percolomonas cosmopolitus, Strain AE-1 (ATCC 50343)" /LENGTH=435 /DNA_ID=CAMNT_0005208527 /DNA_START=172 /DNA_END=1479 /DNA_ORIENTATION=+